jgi:hypothetical protein
MLPENHFVARAFDQSTLKRVCEMHEDDFAEAYEMVHVPVPQKVPDDFYLYRDNGADVLAVAHLDTVGMHWEREANFVETESGLVVFSRALDDRLGAYIILELLPKLGIQYDWLLTVGEECGRSTAHYFEPPEGKEYDWMIEFDRGGTDVVAYQYDDADLRERVRMTGARMEEGIFSDICYLEHLGIKGLNWGVGYRDYHGPRAHAYLEDTFEMVEMYVDFHELNEGEALPHYPETRRNWWGSYSSYRGAWGWEDDYAMETKDAEVVELPSRECDNLFGYHDHDDAECARLIELMSIGVGREDAAEWEQAEDEEAAS